MSAANRKPYLGETLHFAVRDSVCRAAIATSNDSEIGLMLTWFPVGALPIPAISVQHDEERTINTWHYSH